jgi:catechol 2,3-dioxygenase-like lactoylglutathione lyase family enzyme
VSDAVVNHVGLCVHDLDRSMRFYTELFGFEVVSELAPPDGPTAKLLRLDPPVGLRAVYLRLGRFTLELLAYDPSHRPAPGDRAMDEPGLTHLSFGVDDVAAAAARVEELGGTVLADTDLGVAVFVRDPDGQLLELLARR